MNRMTLMMVLLLLTAGAQAQIIKSAGMLYFDSIPNVNVVLPWGAEWAYSVKQEKLYRWDRQTNSWVGTTGDDWGGQVVEHDNTLTGDGVPGDELKVDTTVVAPLQALRDTAADIRADIPSLTGLATTSAVADTASAIRATISSPSGANEYLIISTSGQEVLAVSDGTGQIAATKNSAGNIAFTIPATIKRFEIHFLSEWAGKDASNDLNIEFIFLGTRPYNQSATTMRRPDVTWYNRDGSGFSAPDVRDDDNQPQHQFHLYYSAGYCKYTIKRVDAATKWAVSVRF